MTNPNGSDLRDLPAPCTLADLAALARERLDPVHWDFFAGGAGDERTLRANESAFARHRLVPRVLRRVGTPRPATTLLGCELSMPALVAPTAFHRLAHPDGESATARAAGAAGTVMVASMAATTAVEDIAAAAGAGRLWFQLYLHPDQEFTASVVRRVEAAGCRALVVTVDSPVLGRHRRDLRNGFVDLPTGFVCENMRERTGGVRSIESDASAGWDRIAWLRTLTGLPIVLKGVLHPDDARLAVEHGADALIVSNHGGRQLDGAIAAVDALPAVVRAVAGRLPVILDGGVRSGTDVIVALALGASAVALGRPILWGLAAGGSAGVRHVLELLRAELAHAMALMGAARPADLTADLVVETPGGHIAAPCPRRADPIDDLPPRSADPATDARRPDPIDSLPLRSADPAADARRADR